MVGILLVTHNGLGDSFVDCVRHVLGEVPRNLKVLTVLAGDDPQLKLMEGQALIKQLDTGGGVLILADIFGATPSNIARQLCHAERVMGVAGVNLPMLLRAVCCPTNTLPELAKIAVEGGRECIVYIDQDN
ncbi:MAG: PTS fructose transporter subunit IIA [Gallionellales bacterium RBG_16_57_15]|nr:MAG: PTS fructose transporter subunit IIA [Gallionellales bacterium RBG_16_57_15]